MKYKELRCLLMLFMMSCLLLPSCGGSDGGSGGPEGIFDGPVALVSASPPSDGAMIAASGLVSATEIMGTGYIPASDIVDIEVQAPTIKDIILSDRVDCARQGEMKRKCFVRWESIEANSDIEFSELGRQMGKGHAQIYVRFWNSSFLDKCGRTVGITGMAQCSLDFDISNESENSHAIVSGLCNSASDNDKVISVDIDGESHQIGFDLSVDYNNESKITDGIVSIDGTSYQLEDLQNQQVNKCE